MFRRIFGPGPEHEAAATATETAFAAAESNGDTATVRRIAGKLEELPPDRARLVASGAYILARAANADLRISDAETRIIEEALQTAGALDESTAVLVAEMAKFQANTVGGTEDYVVTREFVSIATEEQKRNLLRACFLISASDGSISAEESSEVNQIAKEFDLDAAVINQIRAEFHEQLSSVQEVRRLAEGA